MSPVEMGRLVKLIEDSLREVKDEAQRGPEVAAALLGTYSIVPFAPLGAPPDFDTPLIVGKPVGHSWSCRCDKCDTYNRSVHS